MPIPNPEPYLIPASTEDKEYPHLWILNMRIRSNSPTEGSISIDVAPYNATTGEILAYKAKRIHVNNLWELMEVDPETSLPKVPEAAQAMGAIFASVAPIMAYQEALRNPPVVEPEPDLIEEPPAEEPPPEEVV